MIMTNSKSDNIIRSIVILILIIALFGCKEQNELKDLSTFKSIDYSFYVGYFQSIKILSNGVTHISESSEYSGTKFYSLTLDKTILDSLSKMTELVFNIKLDSIYEASICDHPISFSLMIKTKERTISTSYNGDQNETQWNSLFHLTNYLGSICKKEIEHVDSSFIFETKSKLILPPAPPPRPK
jgi:hypothetical protein